MNDQYSQATAGMGPFDTPINEPDYPRVVIEEGVVEQAVYDLDAVAKKDNSVLRFLPNGGWEVVAIITEQDSRYGVTGRFSSWEEAEAVAKEMNKALSFPVNEREFMEQQIKDSKKIIAALLLVLHDHTGSKKRIADKAREFLGLKPGAKVGSFDDRMEVSLGRRFDGKEAKLYGK